MTPYEAAIRANRSMSCDPQQRAFTAEGMEGRHIPAGTFDEFVGECRMMGLCVHSHRKGKTAIISGR